MSLNLLSSGLGFNTPRFIYRGRLDGPLRPLDGTGTGNRLLSLLLECYRVSGKYGKEVTCLAKVGSYTWKPQVSQLPKNAESRGIKQLTGSTS